MGLLCLWSIVGSQTLSLGKWRQPCLLGLPRWLCGMNQLPTRWVLATPEFCPQAQPLSFLEKGISVSKKSPLVPGLASCRSVFSSFHFGSVVIVFCRQSLLFVVLGYGFFLVLLQMGFSSHFHSIYFSVDQRREAYMCLSFCFLYWKCPHSYF